MPTITALYAGILGLMAVAIAFRCGMLRGRFDVSLGDGGHPELLLAIRRHGNFAEWVPLALILIGILELEGVTARAIHALGAVLVLSRISHAVGLKADAMQSIGRLIGAAGRALVTVVASIWAIVIFFNH